MIKPFIVVLNEHTIITCWARTQEQALAEAETQCAEELGYQDLNLSNVTVLPVEQGQAEVVDLREAL